MTNDAHKTGDAQAGSGMDIDAVSTTAERLHRFQSLAAGQYWRAKAADSSKMVDADEVLLIESLRWVDDTVHTVVLRAHPSKIGRGFFRAETIKDSDGTERVYKRAVTLNEHRYLLADFLSRFEFEPDHLRIRADEARAVQQRIQALQAELIEAQANPALLGGVVQEGLKRDQEQAQEKALEAARQELGKASADGSHGAESPEQSAASHLKAEQDADASAAVTPWTPWTSLSVVGQATLGEAVAGQITQAGVQAMRDAAAREHRIATIKSTWIQEKTQAIAETLKALTPFYEEQAAAALAATEDVRTYVQNLMDGIQSLDLYVGAGVTVETLREGESAPSSVPLTFVQRKLLMDEELAIWADLDESFDFHSDAAFIDALRAHDELLDQIFPTQRCVLVMATTRRHIDYGDAFTNMATNAKNNEVFLLIRDGTKVHRVYSSVESHLGAARLFPTNGEHEGIFRGLDGTQTRFEDVTYTDRMAEHALFALHYRRFLILAAGLDHRLKLFGNFYDGPPSMAFLSMSFQEEYCRFLYDDDTSVMLDWPRAMPSLDDWIAEKNSYLRSGSRVLCNWRELMNPMTAPSCCQVNERSDRGYWLNFEPKHDRDICIAYRDSESICVDITVSGQNRRAPGARTFNAKVNITAFKDGYYTYTDQPYLCLDAVRIEELQWYIHHRASRQNHLEYIRFFKAAARFIEAEATFEASARAKLTKALLDGGIVGDMHAAENLVQKAVMTWRAARRGRPLPAFDTEADKKDWESLLDQMFALAGTGPSQVEAAAALARARGWEPLRLVMTGASRLVLYATPNAAEQDDRVQAFPWVHRLQLQPGKTKLREIADRWARLPAKAASETVLHEWDAERSTHWAKLGEVSRAFASPEAKRGAFETINAWRSRLEALLAPWTDEQFEDWLSTWRAVRRAANNKAGQMVRNPDITISVGLLVRRKNVLAPIALMADTEALLWHKAPSDARRQEVRRLFVAQYANKTYALETFERLCARFLPWRLCVTGGPVDARFEVDWNWNDLMGRPGDTPTVLADGLQEFLKQMRPEHGVVLADGLFDDDGRLILDDIFRVATSNSG